ncbi:MAG TPA: type I methionyl aminopeptidase [Chloroflexia bacterium]|nr:type I methionyl aminopeptidase [Chloroflexia bacterium]
MALGRPNLKSAADLAIMRQSGRIVAETLALLTERVRPGMTTADLDKLAYEHIRSRGAVPSFKGYNGFPGSICASVNDEIVHGIPGPRMLAEGDLISLDCGAFYRGFHGDAATTVGVGPIAPAAQKMIDVGWESLSAGIQQARPGNRVEDIGATIQDVLESHGYGVVRDLVGHGIGRHLHEPPNVPNFGTRGQGPKLQPGMVLAIEPMLTQGDYEGRTLADEWTIVTVDGGLAVHVEHTVVVTEGEPEILTRL